MNKKAYIIPLVKVSHYDFCEQYCAGENSIPYGGGEGGGGIAEGKEREDKDERDNGWGNLW